MHTGEWRLGHRPGLDGLRGVAVLLVVGCHLLASTTFRAAGSVGVTMFFALSGFLIATLLLEELDRTGRVHVIGFYGRRARRLLPALLVVATVVAAVGLLVDGFTRPGMVAGSLLYVSNWVAVSDSRTDALDHTWSLSIEEQFYLVAPFVVTALRRRPRLLLGLCSAGAVAVLVLRAGSDDGRLMYFATHMRADALLVGIGLAAAMRLGVRPGRSVWLPVAVATLAACCLVPVDRRAFFVLVPTMVAVATVPLIRWALTAPAPLCGPRLSWVGRRSYGLYLWHVPILYGCALGGLSPLATAVLGLPAALLATAASWRFVEQPFQRRRSVRAVEPAALLGARGRVHAG